MHDEIEGAWCGCEGGPANCCQPFCPYYHYTMELVGRRWTGAIIRALMEGLTRFGELRDTIPDISDRMLSERLKELEAEGIVTRTVIPDTPVRIEYRLTPKGRDLDGVIQASLGWAHRWLHEPVAR